MKEPKKAILYFLMVLSFIPIPVFLILAINNSYLDLSTDILLILGSVAGLTGFVMMFWQYVIGIRSVVTFFTKDVSAVNKLHQILGKYGFALIFLHPIVLFFYYIINFSISLISLQIITSFDLYVKIGAFVFTLMLVLWVTSVLAKNSLGFRRWKFLHLFYYLALPIVYIHSNGIGSLMGSTAIKQYIQLLLGIFIMLALYKLLVQIGILKYKYKVKTITQITYNVIEITLEPFSRRIIPNIGQYVYLQLSRLKESHPFTISKYDPTSHLLSIGIKFSGPFSSQLKNLLVGQIVYIEGPYGVFTENIYKQGLKNIVLIAGGIGITPFLIILEYIKNHGDINTFLFYGNRTQADIAYKDLIEKISTASNIKVINTLSDKADQSEEFEHGYVNVSLMKKYIKDNLSSFNFYICGPEQMMDDIKKALLQENVSPKSIFMEEFSF